jgi:hypothetical protein
VILVFGCSQQPNRILKFHIGDLSSFPYETGLVQHRLCGGFAPHQSLSLGETLAALASRLTGRAPSLQRLRLGATRTRIHDIRPPPPNADCGQCGLRTVRHNEADPVCRHTAPLRQPTAGRPPLRRIPIRMGPQLGGAAYRAARWAPEQAVRRYCLERRPGPCRKVKGKRYECKTT